MDIHINCETHGFTSVAWVLGFSQPDIEVTVAVKAKA